MEQHNFLKHYRVFKNQTAITEISANNFLPVPARHFKNGFLTGSPMPFSYSLPVDEAMYYGYGNKGQAMEMAKAGALRHIGMLISKGDSSAHELLQYRIAHYDDLNKNLLDSNIRREAKNK